MTLRSGVGSKTSMHRVADLDGELELGAGVGLGRVLEVDVGARACASLELLAQPRALDGDVDDAVLVGAEHDPALQRATSSCRGARSACLAPRDRLEGALDQVLAGLGEHLDRRRRRGSRSSSISCRTKSKSVWLADGKPTSISL